MVLNYGINSLYYSILNFGRLNFAHKLTCTLNTQGISIHPFLQLSLVTLARNGTLD